MALDNAQFISELSITDPPGTDPLSEGDDQIRTAKRAVFQSFPNVDAQVSLTAAQLNDAALKSAAQTFSGSNTFSVFQFFQGNILLNDGSAGAPAYTFTSAQSTGLFIPGASQFGFTVNGIEQFRISNSIISILGGITALRGASGTAAAPGYTFNAQTDQGIFRESNVLLGFSVLGVRRFTMGAELLADAGGSAGFPTYSWAGDTDTGMFNLQANFLDFTTGGTERLRITTSTILPFVSINAPDGTAALPSYSFNSQSNVGMYRVGTNELGFAVGASVQFRIKNNTAAFPLLPTSTAGLVAGDLWRNPVSPGFVAIV